MTPTEKAIRDYCGHHADWWPSTTQVQEMLALAQPEQEPVAYDKTEMNCFVQDLYDKKMQEGKHGHYETMFHVVHQAIKKVPPQRTWVGLTLDDIPDDDTNNLDFYRGGRWAERVLKEKNT